MTPDIGLTRDRPTPCALKLVPNNPPMERMHALTSKYVEGRWKRREITRPTFVRSRSILDAFAESYGARPPDRFSRADIERWMETRGHLAPGTRRNEWSTVRGFARWLVEQGVIRRDPFIGKKAPRVPRTAERALTPDECERVEAALPDARAWACYALMRWVGLRRAEVLGLEVGDWDRRGSTLRVLGKGGHERIEPVPPWVAVRLSAYLTESRALAGPIVRTLDGQRGISHSYLGRLMATWMTDAGVKAAAFDGRGCHSLRHTIASELVEAGADIKVVQELLGHQSLTSTQVYLRRANAARVLEAMERARAA